jgi:hypothetical protein
MVYLFRTEGTLYLVLRLAANTKYCVNRSFSQPKSPDAIPPNAHIPTVIAMSGNRPAAIHFSNRF